jgi:Glycosyl transferase family 90
LFSIQRAIDAFQGPLPNIEFSVCLGDVASEPEDQHAVWVLTKRREQEEQWIMPDFGYWSWPNSNMGEYNEIRREIEDSEPAWDDKKPLAVWRGAPQTNPLREALIKVTEGKSWSDVRAIEWGNSTSGFLTMPEHCQYQYVMHTEGHSYSGRAKYLLNCASVSITHKLDWIEPHTHLFIPSGPDQNIVVVERDFSDLDDEIRYLLKYPELTRKIAENSARTFRDRYLTPAAQACYWRKLFWAWRSVSFEPKLYEDVEGKDGTVKRKLRGTPFESFVARARVD